MLRLPMLRLLTGAIVDTRYDRHPFFTPRKQSPPLGPSLPRKRVQRSEHQFDQESSDEEIFQRITFAGREKSDEMGWDGVKVNLMGRIGRQREGCQRFMECRAKDHGDAGSDGVNLEIKVRAVSAMGLRRLIRDRTYRDERD